MAGHSAFKNIMHRRARQDAARAKLFAKLAREITVAAKMGMPDPDMNPRLRLAIQAARAENMPKDNIERAIKKAAGGDADNYEAIRYEGYAPGGVAIIAEALTDNRNRTGGAVRAVFTKYGGNLGATGSVAHMFAHVGEIIFPASRRFGRCRAGGGDRRRRRRCRLRRRRPRRHLRLREPRHGGGRARGEARRAGSVKAIWKPILSTPVDEEKAQTSSSWSPCSKTTTTCRTSTPTSRCPKPCSPS